jgi:predicted RND superfamily exporter protein
MLGVLLVSLAWSLGLITTVGHLTVFSVMFISLLIGIGIDYGIYLFFRNEEELGLGRPPREALGVAASQSGPGALFGALTAGGTFGVLMLTEFRGIQEFGFIAGLSVLATFLAMVTLFLAILVTMRRRAVDRVRASGAAARAAHEGAPLLERLLQRPGAILVVAGALTAYSLSAIPSVRFDYNRLNLQARGTESVIRERRIGESAGSGFAALISAGTLGELRDRQAAFERLPAVSDVMSVLTLIPKDQDAKIAAIRDFAPLVSEPVPQPRPRRTRTARHASRPSFLFGKG